jgi:hypothetical protein
LHVLHFGTDDLDAVHARLTRDEQRPSAIRPFQRMVQTQDGVGLMRARSLSFPPGTHPEALLQVAQHLTPELALQPRFMRHPNGATSLTEVIVCVHDPDEVATRYASLAGHAVSRRGALRVIELGRARVAVVDSDHLEEVLPGTVAPTLPFLAGFTVQADLAQAAGWLERKGVPFRWHGERILIGARDACGSAVLLERPDAGR